MNTAKTPCQARRILIPSPTFGVHSNRAQLLQDQAVTRARHPLRQTRGHLPRRSRPQRRHRLESGELAHVIHGNRPTPFGPVESKQERCDDEWAAPRLIRVEEFRCSGAGAALRWLTTTKQRYGVQIIKAPDVSVVLEKFARPMRSDAQSGGQHDGFDAKSPSVYSERTPYYPRDYAADRSGAVVQW